MKSKKKSYYKKKYKGVRYIAQRLTKYQKGKYKNYRQALPDARRFFSQLKEDKKKVILTNIWDLSRTRRTRGGVPVLDRNLSQMSYFFELVDYPRWILRCSNDLYFISELSPDNLPEIQGGTLPEYEQYFADFVNYVNAMKQLTSPGENRYETEWLVTCTEPVFNKAKKRFESKIISVNSNGVKMSYGFDPKNPVKLPTQISPSISTQPPTTTTKPEPTTEPTQPQGSAERAKEVKEIIAGLREDVKAGLLSKEDYAEAIKELSKNLKRGGKL
mgnify:CR=1 FL=1